MIFKNGYKITQKFGNDPDYYKQFGLAGHEGLDVIPNDSDWNIYAVEEGVVVRDVDNPRDYGAYGNLIVIWNKEKKRAWWYAHNNSNQISIGQQVKKGDLISKMGSTGNSSGPHLHLGLRLSDENGVAVNTGNGYSGFINPLPVVEALSVTQPTMDRRPYWFDLMNKVIWNKPHEEITDQMVQDWIKDYPTQRNRSGLWDKLAIKAGYKGDTNVLSVDDLYNLILASGGEAFATRITELEGLLAECKAERQKQKQELIAKITELLGNI